MFDPSVGATASTWYDLSYGNHAGQALAADRMSLDFSNPVDDLDEWINEFLGVTVDITSDRQSFDVFANLSLMLAPNENVGPYEMNFDNTAQFGIETAQDVTYTSIRPAPQSCRCRRHCRFSAAHSPSGLRSCVGGVREPERVVPRRSERGA